MIRGHEPSDDHGLGHERGFSPKEDFRQIVNCRVDHHRDIVCARERGIRTSDVPPFSKGAPSAPLTALQFCAVSLDQRLYGGMDMATVFFEDVFGTELAPRVMSGLIAFSVFGNIVVMTFTASRGTAAHDEIMVGAQPS